ncbi:MAG: lipopolysaccharide biosynthesis protein [Chloroflexi bacterium HGW-Chloroflexi-5]|jgi:PST family polysaccharide transporter|nr:MAG: lipopolysaccharide biosynthesis protein [Chloroflexi bacterium HGW-Chloroflexi-5]
MNPQNDNEIFSTNHLIDNLKSRAIKGGAITLIGQGLKFVLQMTSTAILARLLTPADFGLIAMVSAITGFILIFKDLGLSMATIQQPKITQEQISTLFWVNVAFSFIVLLVMGLLSPVIAWFYDESKLIWVTIILSTGIMMGGFSVQHQALLRRQMRYINLALIDVIALLFGLITAIASAFLGLGYWSLVIQQLMTALITLIGVLVSAKWKPGLPSKQAGIKSMLNFGKNMTIYGILNYFARNLDNILIGRFLGAASLGFYSRAYSLILAPISQIISPLTAVANPTLSRLQDDPLRFRNYYLKAIKFIAYATIPLIAFMGVLSKEIIALLLGEQWGETAKLFQILAISAIWHPLGSTVGWIYVSLGKTDRMAKWGFISIPLIILSFIIGLRWGAQGVAIGYTIIILLLIYPQFAFALHGTLIKTRDVVSSIYPALVIAAISALIVFFTLSFIGYPNPIIRIIIGLMMLILVSLVYYFLSNRLRNDVKDILEIAKLAYKK